MDADKRRLAVHAGGLCSVPEWSTIARQLRHLKAKCLEASRLPVVKRNNGDGNPTHVTRYRVTPGSLGVADQLFSHVAGVGFGLAARPAQPQGNVAAIALSNHQKTVHTQSPGPRLSIRLAGRPKLAGRRFVAV